jgi:hypothetical protein
MNAPFISSLGSSLRISVIGSITFSSLSKVLPESCYFDRPDRQKSAMAKSGEYTVGNRDAPRTGQMLLDMPTSVALRIVEGQMQLPRAEIPATDHAG